MEPKPPTGTPSTLSTLHIFFYLTFAHITYLTYHYINHIESHRIVSPSASTSPQLDGKWVGTGHLSVLSNCIFPLRMEELLGAKRPTPSHDLSNLTCRFPPKYYKKNAASIDLNENPIDFEDQTPARPTRTANYGNVQTLKGGVPTAVLIQY